MNSKFLLSAAVVLILAFGIYYFILSPNMNDNINYMDIFIKGAILGFVVYGVYDLTNLLSINNFTLKEGIVDIIWGTSLSGTISVLSIFLLNQFS